LRGDYGIQLNNRGGMMNEQTQKTAVELMGELRDKMKNM
jgi:hypothetical protein